MVTITRILLPHAGQEQGTHESKVYMDNSGELHFVHDKFMSLRAVDKFISHPHS